MEMFFFKSFQLSIPIIKVPVIEGTLYKAKSICFERIRKPKKSSPLCQLRTVITAYWKIIGEPQDLYVIKLDELESNL